MKTLFQKGEMTMEYQDVFVVTTYRLGEIFHCLPETLMWNFLDYEDRFVEGVDYYQLTAKELETCEAQFPGEFVEYSSPYLWTFEGMYKHAHFLSGENAWKAFLNLVYFLFEQTEEIRNAVRLLEQASRQLETMYIYRICEKEWNAQ